MPESQKTGLVQEEMNKLSGTSDIDHAFPDKEEAKRFEGLMTKYKVDTVFLSHIHAYYSFVRGDVRYIISGGAGAELLTKDSYYHFIRVKVTDKENYLEGWNFRLHLPLLWIAILRPFRCLLGRFIRSTPQ